MIFHESLKIFFMATAFLVILIVETCFMNLQASIYNNNDHSFNKNNIHSRRSIINVDGIKYVSNKNGVKQWIMKAKHIYINKTGEKIFVCSPKFEFFLKNNDKFYLSAISGLINSLSNNVITFGDVYINGLNITVKTDHAEYNADCLSLISKKSTVFFGDSFSVNSDSFIFNLDSKLFQFNGNVKSKFNNAFQIF